MTQLPFVIIDHTADWSLKVYGRTLTDLFIHAAQGMTSLMVAEPDAIERQETLQVELDAYDAESLLVDWLTELAYWAEMGQMVGRDFVVTAASATDAASVLSAGAAGGSHTPPAHLSATVHGSKADELQKHIKAVTFHNMEIIEVADGLEVTIVFDV